MSSVTELVMVAVLPGKEARAKEWLTMLQAKQAECVATLEREHMHYESVFRCELNGRLYLSWFSVQGLAAQPVGTSELEVDKLHLAFWRECIDDTTSPVAHEHIVSFVPAEVVVAINQRALRLSGAAAQPFAPPDVRQPAAPSGARR